jgi:hypothetical protein
MASKAPFAALDVDLLTHLSTGARTSSTCPPRQPSRSTG